jgi:Uncharacterized conserved protein
MTTKPSQKHDNKASLLTFPSDFPLKIMGDNQEGFLEAIAQLVQEHDFEFDTATIEQRYSKGGNYMSLRVTITATSQEQLDNLYRALTSHPMVKVVF